MGIYLNPSADGFASIMKTGDYVDKTGLITYMNAVLNSSRNMLCSSRPRRFGKSYAAQMLSAFYSKGADAGELFAHLRVANPPEETKEKEKEWYNKYRNNCDVLFWDMPFGEFTVLAVSQSAIKILRPCCWKLCLWVSISGFRWLC